MEPTNMADGFQGRQIKHDSTGSESLSRSDCSEDDTTQFSMQQPPQSASSTVSHSSFSDLRVAGVGNPPGFSPNNLSGLVSNVHRTTGREPPPLVGASTTIVGDKLYVFGGRRIKPQRLTRSLYVLDLISRHWTKLEASGDVPAPRFFHSLCALGDTKLVCYGGMALIAASQSSRPDSETEPAMTVTSDVHVYDIATRVWKNIPASSPPPRRYAHCATIVPSSAVFSSSSAPLSALRHNPSSDMPNQGTLGVSIDGRGGAELIVVGGQDGQSHFIDSIEVFNFRSLKWSSPLALDKSYGAYRSVIAPLIGFPASHVGRQTPGSPSSAGHDEDDSKTDEDDIESEYVSGSPMLIFSNYNFLNTKVEVQIRQPDGSLAEKQPRGRQKPPGLRFPNGGVIDKHLIVSGTYITSSQQEYMIWALDLQNLQWHRIDAGGGGLNEGSWNRGALWHKRNTYIVLGSRRRRLNDDYNTRRLNFSNICTVELEAFGLFENPRSKVATDLHRSNDAPSTNNADHEWRTRDLQYSRPVEALGNAAMTSRELCDMELLSRDGERIPVNSQFLRVRWGPYFQQLLLEDLTRARGPASTSGQNSLRASNITNTARTRSSVATSIATVTPSIASTSISNGTTAIGSSSNNNISTSRRRASASLSASSRASVRPRVESVGRTEVSRSRLLYLPHTYLTIRALVHYLYTTSLPPLTSPFCTPQILCSLLQIARPYRIDGLLEATIERLHEALDGRNTAAIFNAAAMAAGGGDAIRFVGDLVHIDALNNTIRAGDAASTKSSGSGTVVRPAATAGTTGQQPLPEDDSLDEGGSSTSASTASISDVEEYKKGFSPEAWKGGLSAVVGLQKRGLRGLMEFRRLRNLEGQQQVRGNEQPAGRVMAGAPAGALAAAQPDGAGYVVTSPEASMGRVVTDSSFGGLGD